MMTLRSCSMAMLLCGSFACYGAGPLTGSPVDASELPPSLRPAGPVTVLVRLEGEPAWRSFSRAGGRAARWLAEPVAQNRVASLQARQSDFVRAAAVLGAVEQQRFSFLDNAVVLSIDARNVADLRRMPGVVMVAANRRYEREHTTSMPLLRASDAWSTFASGGFALDGSGVTIAIIDEGIDYTHRHFGGDGNYELNDRAVLGDVAWPPATLDGIQRVIGGHDFVGDDYNFDLPPQPDPDPVGCPFSHGTHVAGTAAGHGVAADGSTYGAPLIAGTSMFPSLPAASLADFRIGPGTAPRANLVSLRVFGCSGSTSTAVLLQAMEAAGSDTWLGVGADVVNMSLGSGYGGTGPDDFLMGAQQALVELGIVVVASAGNNGDFQLVTGAPGTAAGTISVANITDTANVVHGRFEYTDPVDGTTLIGVPALRGAGYPFESPDPLTAALVRAVPADGCATLTPPVSGAYAGAWIVIDRGGCDFFVKQRNALQAGGAGAIVINNQSEELISMAGEAATPLPAIFMGLSGGTTLKSKMLSHSFGGTFDGSIGSGFAELPLRPSPSTSRGGVLRGSGDRILKPNLAAPGSSITSAGGGTNDGGYTIGGTSMAAPHIAGVAALIIKAHGRPNDAEGVARIKQRLMSTAVRDISNDGGVSAPFHSPQRIGAGLADAVAAIGTSMVAYATDAPENGSLSFGYPRQLTGVPLQLTKTITLLNLGGVAIDLDTAYAPRSTWAGASLVVSPSSLTLPANGTAEVTVTLEVNGDVANLNVPGDPLLVTGNKTLLHEISGYAVFTESGGPASVRVAVYAAPHIAADIRTPDTLFVDTVGTSQLPLSGVGFNLGPDANDHQSLVSVYTLIAADGEETDLYWDVNGDGIDDPAERLVDYSYADIRYLGGSLHESGGTTTLHLGVAMHGEWVTPRDLYVEALVDVNDDGTFDYLWYIGTGVSDDQTVNVVVLASDEAYGWDFINYGPGTAIDTMLLRSNVLSLPVAVADAFLESRGGPAYSGGPIRVRTNTYQRDSDFAIEIDSVDATWQPGVDFGGGNNLFTALGGQVIPFAHDFSALPAFPSLLTLHHHNLDPDARAIVTTLGIAPQPFALLTPADGVSVASALELEALSWEAMPGASGYTVTVAAAAFTGTPADDGDAIRCDATTCTLPIGPLDLDAGTYAWTVEATHPQAPQTASNGPFDFTLQGDLPDLIFRGGFED